jgi:hypothetical protein
MQLFPSGALPLPLPTNTHSLTIIMPTSIPKSAPHISAESSPSIYKFVFYLSSSARHVPFSEHHSSAHAAVAFRLGGGGCPCFVYEGGLEAES